MKKTYEKPQMEVIKLSVDEHIMTATASGKPCWTPSVSSSVVPCHDTMITIGCTPNT